VGIDYDAAMITEATRRADVAGVSGWVTHQQGDATALPCASASFDACRSERLFQHLPQPEHALSEMVRVTKPGGWVVVFDADWGTLSVDAPDVAIERLLARVHGDYCVHNGYAGRQLYRLFHQQDVEEISVELLPVYITDYALAQTVLLFEQREREALARGLLTEEELGRWRTSLDTAAAQGTFFAQGCAVMVAARRG
jgi:ubiquinone/menaquinone biosynthesis C-methylase UbiE